MIDAPLHVRVAGRTPELARRMVDRFVTEIPVYAALPTEQLHGEVLEICIHNLDVFFRCLAEERAPVIAELADLRASAARRAEERVPVDAVLSAYHLGGRIGWQALVDEADDDEHDELVGHAGWLLRYLETVTGTVAAAYVEEQQLIYGEERDARRAFADALLDLEHDDDDGVRGRERLLVLADRAGVSLAEQYVVAAVRLGLSADERTAGVDAPVAGRRKVRRLVERLDASAGGSVLSLLDAGGGLVLVPSAPDLAVEFVDRVRRTVHELCETADAEVLMGLSWRPDWSGTRHAATEAREVLRIATKLGRTSGALTAMDVLLEQSLTASGRARLVRILDPLEAHPDLLATLEAWFASDFDRQEAARRLHVHPNTVDYRLRRIAAETDQDLGTARGLQVLGAALTARAVG